MADVQVVDNPFFSRLWIRMSANEPMPVSETAIGWAVKPLGLERD